MMIDVACYRAGGGVLWVIHWPGTQETWALFLALPQTSLVAWGKSVCLNSPSVLWDCKAEALVVRRPLFTAAAVDGEVDAERSPASQIWERAPRFSKHCLSFHICLSIPHLKALSIYLKALSSLSHPIHKMSVHIQAFQCRLARDTSMRQILIKKRPPGQSSR